MYLCIIHTYCIILVCTIVFSVHDMLCPKAESGTKRDCTSVHDETNGGSKKSTQRHQWVTPLSKTFIFHKNKDHWPLASRWKKCRNSKSPTLFFSYVASHRTKFKKSPSSRRTSCEYQCNGRYYHYITPEHIIIAYQTGYILYNMH